MWASDTITSLAKPSSPRAFNASNAAPLAYTVTDASNGWPIVLSWRASSNAFCTDVRKSNNWFHLSANAWLKCSGWPCGQSWSITDSGMPSSLGMYFQTSSAVKESTGDTIATNVFKISYIAVWAERRATLFLLSAYIVSFITSR